MSILSWLARRSVRSQRGRRHPHRKCPWARLWLEPLEDRILLAAVAWINPHNGIWEDPANWSTSSVPGVGDDVVIQTGGLTVSLTAPETVHNLASSGSTINMASGDSLTVNGLFEWDSGTLAGHFIIASTGTMAIGTNSDKTLGGATLDNAGTIVWSAGEIDTYLAPVINNHGTWDAQADAVFYQLDSTRASINNYGTVSRTAGTGTASFEAVSFNNLGGAIDVASTNLVIGGGASTGGSFSVAAGATVSLQSYNGDTQTLTGTYTGSGAGTVVMTGNPFSGSYPLTLAIGATGATFDFTPGLFQWSYGRLTGPGTLTNLGAIGISGNGSIAGYLDAATLDNRGTVVWSGGEFDTANAPVINNHGTWDAQADSYFYLRDSTRASFNNYGTLSRTAGTGTASFEAVSFNNLGGAIDVASTNLVIGGGASTGGSFSVAAGATVSLQSYYGDTQALTGTYTGAGAGIVVMTGNAFSGSYPLTLAIGAAGATFDFAPGLFQWSYGRLTGPGTLTNRGALGISGNPSNAADYLDGATLDNQGTVVWSGGIIRTYNAPVINNHGNWDAQADAYFVQEDSTRGSINNYGTVSRTTGTGTASFEAVSFNNLGGAIDVASTNLVIGGGASTGGSFSVAGAATVSLQSYNGDTQTLTGTYTGSGAGIVVMTGNAFSGSYPLTLAIGAAGATFDFAPGLFQWSYGRLTGPGTLTNQGAFGISGNSSKAADYLDGATLDNTGTVVWSDGIIRTYNAPVINNHGNWDAQADAYFVQEDSTRGSFNSYGTVSRTTGTGTASFEAVSFNNLGGAIDVASTNLVIGGGASTGGSFSVAAGASVSLQSYNGDTQTLTGTYTGSGAGTVVMTGNPFSGSYPLTLAVGAAGATFDFAPGLFQWSYGRLTGPGTLTNRGALGISGNPSKSADYLDGATLDNRGTVVWSADEIDTYNAPVINNYGTWDAQADAFFFESDTPRGSFNNYGTLSRTTGTGTAHLDELLFNNRAGSINVASCTLVIGAGASSGGAFTAAAGATLEIQSAHGGTQTLTGAYTGTGAGTVAFASDPYSGYTTTLAIGAAGATFDFAPGLFQWSYGPFTGPGTLTNVGSMTLTGTGPRNLDPGALINSGNLTVSGLTLVIGSAGLTTSVENTGTLGATAGGIIDLHCPLSIDASGILAGEATASILIRGNLTGKTKNADQDSPMAVVQFDGAGTAAAPQLMEVMSQDQGASAAAFANNFAYNQLIIGNGTTVRLLDQFQNAAAPGAEAVYVNSLVVASYTTLDLNGLHVYARDSEIDGTVTGGTVTTLPPGGPILLNTPTPGNIAVAGQIHDWTFFGRAGQTVSIIGNPGSGAPAPLSPNLGYARVSISDATGNVLATGSSANKGDVVPLLGVLLPADGIYHVSVQAPTGQTSATGHYQLSVYNAPITPRPLVLNQQVVGKIATAYSIDRWTFSAPANTAVQFQWINAAGPLQFSLHGPGGWTGFSGLTGNSGPVTLPTSGTYTLDASSGGGLGGTYAFRLAQLTQTDLTLGTPYSGTLAGSGQSQLFRVTLPVTEQLLVTLTDSAAADHNEVYVKYGAPPTRADYQYRFSTSAAANQKVLVPTATAGTCYILVYDDLVPAPGSFTLTASVSSIFLTAVTPNSQGTAADAMLTLTGIGFTPAPAVSLVAAGGTVYPAASVVTDSATQIVATFKAGSVPAGVYTVRATAADGSTATLPGVFTLVAGGKAVLTTNIIVPNPIGYHTASTIYVDYSNTGNVPMAAPILVVSATQNGVAGALLTLDASVQTAGYWTSANPTGFAQSVELLASGAQPGMLQPGESMRVPVYYAGWLHNQWDFSRPPITFTVGVLGTDSTEVIGWASMEAPLQPASISTGAWNALYPNLTAQLGGTWGAYVQRLDAGAQYLASLGENVSDIDKLLAFEIQQASGFSTLGTLAIATDAQVAAPGLPLSFGRSLLPGIIERNQFGRFGWGWTDSWQTTLTTEADGSVVVTGAGGAQLTFQPDSRPGGAYFAQAGEHGSLVALPGGGDTLTQPNGLVTAYHPNGTLDYLQDADGNRIAAGYTGGLLTRLTHSSGQSLTIAYNAAGLVSSITDSAGRTTTYHYDPTNQYLTSVVDFDGRTTTYAYDTGSNLVTTHALLSVTYPDGTHTFFTYDTAGRLADVHRDAGADETTFAYHEGQVSAANALHDTTNYFFDGRGLLVQVQAPLGNGVHLTYDQNLNLVQTADALGRISSNTYDAQGKLLSATDTLGHTMRYTYAPIDGRVASVTDADGNTTRYGYDGKGDLTSTTYADGSVESAAYDPIGNVMSAADSRGLVSHYTYDTAGNVLTTTYADGSTVTFTYDGHENLTSATDTSGTTTLTYDTKDRLTQITYPSGRYLKYTYDVAGRRTQMIDQTGFTVNYSYDAAGRLAGLTDGAGMPIVTYTYDAVGRMSRKDNGNANYTTYAYDAAGELLHLVNFARNGAINSRFDYTYDSLGQQITQATLDGTWTYSYDAIGDLTHAVFTSTNALVPNQDLAYFYDAAGNRTSTLISGVTTTYTTNNLNEYTQVGATTYGYDADGNLISATDAGGTTTYTFNVRNQLTGITGPAGSWAYQYDVFGNRIGSTQSGTTTNYLIDPAGLGNVVSAYDGAGSLIAHYTYGLGLTSQVNAAGAQTYYDFDGLGSTVGVSGATGTYVTAYRYLPFGETTATGTASNPFQFVGRAGVMTEANGLQFMRARFYDTAQGRFTRPDPIGLAGGSNLYAYVRNNPVGAIDASGLVPGVPPAAELFCDIVNYLIQNYGFSSPVTGRAYTLIRPFSQNLEALETFADAIGLNAESPTIIDYGAEFFSAEARAAAYEAAGGDLLALAEAEGLGAAAEGVAGAAVAAEGGAFLAIGETVLTVAVTGLAWASLIAVGFGVGVLIGYGLYTYRAEIAGFFEFIGNAIAAAVNSFDPNDKVGPAGFGTSHFVAVNAVLPYRVDFENDPTATAPAQSVTIIDQLDSHLDWNTFALAEVGFGDIHVPIPAGSQNFQTTVDTTENGKTFHVQINLGINALTGQVFATFYSIDPATGLPPANVLTGFLPPEDGTGRGMGYFTYTIQPKSNLPTGTAIRNVALVTFDVNPPIATDQVDENDPSKGVDPNKQALVTIDAGPPSSSVTALPATEGSPVFTVAWTGADDTGGSGIASYNVYVSDNGGPFTLFETATALTSATFTGQDGHTYGFYSVATDNVGHVQPTPGAAQATTKVTLPPGFSYDPNTKILTITGSAAQNSFSFGQATTQDAAGALHTTYTFGLNGNVASYADTELAMVVVTAAATSQNTAILITKDTFTGIDGQTHETVESISLGSKADAGVGSLEKLDATGKPFTFLTLSNFPISYAYVGRADGAVSLYGTVGVPYNGFVSAGNYAYVGGPGIFHLAQGAPYVYGYSAGQATDFAYHYSANPGSSYVVSGTAFSYMSAMDNVGGVTESFFNVGVGFQQNTGVSNNPGKDYAYIIDSPGNDTFVGGTAYSFMYSTNAAGAFNEFDAAFGFALVFGESFVGGVDTGVNGDSTKNVLVGFHL